MDKDEDKGQISVPRKLNGKYEMHGFYLPPSNKTRIHEKCNIVDYVESSVIVNFHLACDAMSFRVSR